MKHYPFLLCWKQTGLDQFPDPSRLPPDIYIDLLSEPHIARLRKKAESEFLKKHSFRARSPKHRAEIIEQFILSNAEQLKKKVWERHCQLLDDLKNEYLEHCLNASRRVFFSKEKRGDIARDLINSIAPSRQGGKSIPSQTQALVLKKIYLELIDCIREVRKDIGVPLRYTQDHQWDEYYTEEILERFPNILSLFDKKELYLLTLKPTIADLSIVIILERLKAFLPKTSDRTLRDILHATKLS